MSGPVTLGGLTSEEASQVLAPNVAPNPPDEAPKAVALPNATLTRVGGTISQHPTTGRTVKHPGKITP